MNQTINKFVLEFEKRFSNYLVVPPPSKKEVFSNSNAFVYFAPFHNGAFSDWDIACWLKLSTMSSEIMTKMDNLIRNYPDFSDALLFSQPSLTDNQAGVQYMAFTPKDSNGPFLDLHVRGPFISANQVHNELLTAIYNGNVEEHQLWTIITCWRKCKKGDVDDAKKKYNENNKNYWKETENEFIKDPEKFYREKFSSKQPPQILVA